MLGVAVVKDFFRDDIDANTAMSQVTSFAMSDLFYLPPGTIPPMVMPFDPTATIPLCLLSVSSQAFDETRLYDIAYFDLRNRLQGITGVIAPAVYGGKLRRILAYVDRDKLYARHLSPMDVVQALRQSNVFIPTGDAKFGDLHYFVGTNGMVPRVEQLNDIPLKVQDGAPVFLKDVGDAEDAHQIQTNIVRINGRRQVYIPNLSAAGREHAPDRGGCQGGDRLHPLPAPEGDPAGRHHGPVGVRPEGDHLSDP